MFSSHKIHSYKKKSVRYYLVNAQFIHVYEIKKCNHGEFGLNKEEKNKPSLSDLLELRVANLYSLLLP